jgi:hypothetical protein
MPARCISVICLQLRNPDLPMFEVMTKKSARAPASRRSGKEAS